VIAPYYPDYVAPEVVVVAPAAACVYTVRRGERVPYCPGEWRWNPDGSLCCVNVSG
jgi:hypothetical protein